MTLRLVPLAGFVVQGGVASAKGEEWEETLGEFKGLQRMINAALQANALVIDGRIGPLTQEHLDTVLRDFAFGEELSLAATASRARELAVFIGRRLGVSPDFSSAQLDSDYRGGPGQLAPSGGDEKPEPEDRQLTTSREVATAGISGGGVLLALGAVAGGWLAWRWLKRRAQQQQQFAGADDEDAGGFA